MATFELTSLTSFVAATTMLTLVVGYARVLTNERGTVFHLAASISLVLLAYVMRTLYWDALPMDMWLKDVYGRQINVTFDAIALWGAMHGHVAIYRMIPQPERDNWTIWTAWAYPPVVVSLHLRKFLRWLFWRRS